MARVEDIENQLRELSSEERTEFREWFTQFDAEDWDRQFQADVERGKLDELAERALRAHAWGKSTHLALEVISYRSRRAGGMALWRRSGLLGSNGSQADT